MKIKSPSAAEFGPNAAKLAPTKPAKVKLTPAAAARVRAKANAIMGKAC